MSFEQNLERLEALTDAIKKPDISLEDALKSFEEGISLAKRMEKELDGIEGKIQMLMNAPAEPEPEEPQDEEPPESQTTKARRTRAKAQDAPVLDLFNEATELNGTRNG